MVYQTEKTLEDLKDKIDPADKGSVESALSRVKDTLKGTDIAAIKTATEELTKAFYAVSEKLYQQQGAPGPDSGAGTAGGQGDTGDPNVVDADYEVVDDNKD